ncbi:prefoldin subunit 1 isoform X2 [Mauremys reevesii]|uniref:prefoldin subunit 1 isoform X2 n=1 Tax=Mauremys reevesii TaxID=260615 RepID=UPI00193FBC8C|nr:prefoldin subunit 1 isoform X2 [Mauremys reevesii]
MDFEAASLELLSHLLISPLVSSASLSRSFIIWINRTRLLLNCRPRLSTHSKRFILQSKGVIHNQLLEKQKIAEEKIKELEQRKSYLERSVKDAEDNIREMLMARRAQ